MSKKKALIIASAHKPFNKLKKKIGKNHILFYESQLDYGQIKHLKQTLMFNHKSFETIINPNISIKPFQLINPIIQGFLGAIVSNECIKAITNKYIPFNQSQTFNFHKDVIDCPNDELIVKLQGTHKRMLKIKF